MENLAQIYLSDTLQSFRRYKRLAERALEQVSDEDFFALIDPESNSLAIIVKHIAGNLHSRWRDFLTTDGEKPDRMRDTEFELYADDTRSNLIQFWETGWQTLFDSLGSLTESDLTKTVTIRGEPHSVIEAINRQLTHYSYHVGQIVFLAKHLRSSNWQTLSVARNRSEEFNRSMMQKFFEGPSRNRPR
jgi:hypothetical protein